MNSTMKLSIYCLILLTFNIKAYSAINYGNYLKNIYIIPSYYNVDKCFKNSFYENIHKQDYLKNKIIKYKNSDTSEPFIAYKTKLDNIVTYI